MIRRRLREESGYSLVEVIVSILLLSIAILPMIGMFEMGLNVASEAGNYDAARALANANLEKVLSLPYAEAKIAYKPVNAAVPGTPKSCNTGVYDCEVTTHYVSDSLVDNSAATTKMRVEVTVTWTDGNYTTTGLKAQ